MGQSQCKCCLAPPVDSISSQFEEAVDVADSQGKELTKRDKHPELVVSDIAPGKNEFHVSEDSGSNHAEDATLSTVATLAEQGPPEVHDSKTCNAVVMETAGAAPMLAGLEAYGDISHSGNPSLQQLLELWTCFIEDVARSPKATKVKSRDSIDWKPEGSETYIQVLRSMNNAVDLGRFLAAKEGNVKKAMNVAKTAAIWWAAVEPLSVSKEMISAATIQRVWRWAGWTKCGYPILAVDAKLWKPSQYSLDVYIRNAMYTIETAIKHRAGPGVDRGVVIFELEFNFESSKPSAMRCMLSLSTILQEVYSERFAGFFFLKGNAMFHAVWKGLKHLVDPRLAPLVHFVPTQRNREILGKFIDLASLEQCFGGDYPDTYPPVTGDASADIPATMPPAYDPLAPNPLRDPVM